MPETDDYLLSFLQEEAVRRGIPLEELLGQIETMMELVNKPLPEEGRLTYVERLLCDHTIGKDQADMIFAENPLLEPEVMSLFSEAQGVLEHETGLTLPQVYSFRFVSELNHVGLFVDYVDPIERTVQVASHGGITTPILIGHILGHLLQNENSEVITGLRTAYENGGVRAYNEKFAAATEVIEGWAVFLSNLYAKKRDEQLGISFYVPLESELRGWIGLTRYMQRGEKTNEYEQGYEYYQHIYEHLGIAGTVQAAQCITSNAQLHTFAEDHV